MIRVMLPTLVPAAKSSFTHAHSGRFHGVMQVMRVILPMLAAESRFTHAHSGRQKRAVSPTHTGVGSTV